MGKKRRDGRAAKSGNSAPSSNAVARNSHGGGLQRTATDAGIRFRGGVYEGELKGGKPHGTGRLAYEDGAFYEGQFENGKKHGRGVARFSSGEVYDGEWKDGDKHGSGKYTYAPGKVYDGEWKDDKKHGEGILEFANGAFCEGSWKEGAMHGKGKYKYPSGAVYDGEWKEGMKHGRGVYKWEDDTIYDGEWQDNLRHGRGTLTLASGKMHEGHWAGGELHGKGIMKLPTGKCVEGIWMKGELVMPNADARANGTAPEANCEPFEGRKLRSQRSQQRRLEAATNKCEHCGVDDHQYKLQVCSGCNLALYCSAACQKAGSRSHRRICDIASMLPSRDSDRLVLVYDKCEQNDFDACLRYATKYMDSLKHFGMTTGMEPGDKVKLSAKQLSSLLKSKKGALDSVVFALNGPVHFPGISRDGHDVWKELHDLKQLQLSLLSFRDVQHICDIVAQQKDTLKMLALPFLDISWHRAKSRRKIAQAVGSCKHLMKLRLPGCVLMDSDLKVMLNDLPNLRILNLIRSERNNHEFTDMTCGLIARKCPGLQELILDYHNQLSMRGISRIFEGCPHLRALFTTTHKLSGKDIKTLLDSAPQLLHLSLGVGVHISEDELSRIIEATGGRTVIQWSDNHIVEPRSISAKTREVYEHQKSLLSDVWARQADPEVANEWEGVV